MSKFFTSTNVEPTTLTMEYFQKISDMLSPILLYGTSEHIEKGIVYHCDETELLPEYIVFHPSDYEEVKKIYSSFRRLVHIKDEPKGMVADRIIKTLRHLTPHAQERLSPRGNGA